MDGMLKEIGNSNLNMDLLRGHSANAMTTEFRLSALAKTTMVMGFATSCCSAIPKDQILRHASIAGLEHFGIPTPRNARDNAQQT